jgi:hypothetical protein
MHAQDTSPVLRSKEVSPYFEKTMAKRGIPGYFQSLAQKQESSHQSSTMAAL